MNELGYLIRTRIKNFVKQMLKRPAALILYLLLFGLLIYSLVISAGRSFPENPSARWMAGPAGAALGALALLYPLYTGVSEGGTFFSMADVGLLFQSPVKQKTVLIYGILNQMTSTLLIAGLLLLQIGNLRMWLGMSRRGAIAAVAAAFVLIYTINVSSMIVYAICSERPEWRSRFTRIARGGTVLIAAAVLGAFLETRDPAKAAALLMEHPVLSAVPVIGWTKSVFESADSGGLALLLPAGGLLLFAAFVTAVLMRISADFYEDVLVATEKRQARTAEKRSGQARDQVLFKKGFRLKLRGQGAPAIFFRQLSEYARRGFFDLSSLVLVLAGVIAKLSTENAAVLGDRFIVLMMAYMMMFFNIQGLWGRELQKPFLYLLPARPFTKLFFSVLLTPFKAFADGALLALVLIGFTGAPVSVLPVYALTAAGFSAVYTAGDILSRIILGDSKTRTVTMLIYLLLAILLALPGAVLLFVFESLLLGSLFCALWCFGGAGIVMALCCRRIFEFQACA